MERHFPAAEAGLIYSNSAQFSIQQRWCRLSPDELIVDNRDNFDQSEIQVWTPESDVETFSEHYRFRIIRPVSKSIFLLSSPLAGKVEIVIRGGSQRVAILSRSAMKLSARLINDCSLLIGENTSIMGARIFLNSSDISVGCNGLWSDEVIVQGSDQHGIVDLSTGEIINKERSSITIGRHVWLGRRSMVMKNVDIGEWPAPMG
ncbi:hypothetical protein SAMN05892877_1211 [Rhizobium subbaraonis]|uniref:Uncharacterized protein n=2 Tax=Rhizobium subbaraonis TaxID=908946 RepID=A0A285UWQ0_9HYPH|nr:hypothetical protein SAMN05892877_1211 [Rhizobium subbaraonis]